MPEKKEEKVAKVLKVLKTEYPFEGLLLGVLGALVLVLGIYILEGDVLRITMTDFWLFNTPTKITIFSIVVIIIGSVALLVALAPFFMPGLSEMKRVSWPTKNTMTNHTARVFGFVIFLGLMFVLYDFVFRPIFDFLYGLGA